MHFIGSLDAKCSILSIPDPSGAQMMRAAERGPLV
jgi:hypothetical protein